MRRNFEASKEGKQVGLRAREGEEEGRGRRREGEEQRPPPSADSPIPEGFSLADLVELVERVEVEREVEAVEQRRLTRAIKSLASSEEALRALIDQLHRSSLARWVQEGVEDRGMVWYGMVWFGWVWVWVGYCIVW